MRTVSSKFEGSSKGLGGAVASGVGLSALLTLETAGKEFGKEVGKKVGSKVGDKICDLIDNKEKNKDK